MKILRDILEKGVFPISEKQNIYKDSSTAMIAITFIFFLAYIIAKIIQNKKTQYGVEVRKLHLIIPSDKRASASYPKSAHKSDRV